MRAAVETLRQAGWSVVVTSAGCEWYIHRLLADAGVSVVVHANPGRFEVGRGLRMEMPTGSPYLSEFLGVDKHRRGSGNTWPSGGRVAFAGDGFPDADAARLVPVKRRRFARADLADVLPGKKGSISGGIIPWSEIADRLLQGSD